MAEAKRPLPPLSRQHAARSRHRRHGGIQPVVYMDCATSAARPERRDNADLREGGRKPPKATPHNATER